MLRVKLNGIGDEGRLIAVDEVGKTSRDNNTNAKHVRMNLNNTPLKSKIATTTLSKFSRLAAGSVNPTLPYQSYSNAIGYTMNRALGDHVVLALAKRLWKASQAYDSFKMERARFLKLARKILLATQADRENVQFFTTRKASLDDIGNMLWQKWSNSKSYITIDTFNRFLIEVTKDRSNQNSISVEQLVRLMGSICDAIVQPHGFALKREGEITSVYSMAPQPKSFGEHKSGSSGPVMFSNLRHKPSLLRSPGPSREAHSGRKKPLPRLHVDTSSIVSSGVKISNEIMLQIPLSPTHNIGKSQVSPKEFHKKLAAVSPTRKEVSSPKQRGRTDEIDSSPSGKKKPEYLLSGSKLVVKLPMPGRKSPSPSSPTPTGKPIPAYRLEADNEKLREKSPPPPITEKVKVVRSVRSPTHHITSHHITQ